MLNCDTSGPLVGRREVNGAPYYDKDAERLIGLADCSELKEKLLLTKRNQQQQLEPGGGSALLADIRP